MNNGYSVALHWVALIHLSKGRMLSLFIFRSSKMVGDGLVNGRNVNKFNYSSPWVVSQHILKVQHRRVRIKSSTLE